MTESDSSSLLGDLVGRRGVLEPWATPLVVCVSKRKTRNAVRLTARVQKPGSGDIATFHLSLSVRSCRVPRGVNHPTIHVSTLRIHPLVERTHPAKLTNPQHLISRHHLFRESIKQNLSVFLCLHLSGVGLIGLRNGLQTVKLQA